MSGGYRFAIAASGLTALLSAFGFGLYLGVLNYPEPERYQSYRHTDQGNGRVSALTKTTDAAQYRTPCNDPQGRDESDLCAQWRAANAAEESALWTRLGFWVGLFGIIGLYWQVVLTRRAVRDTGDATIAMQTANEIAANTAERQLRAYVGIAKVKTKSWQAGEYPTFMIRFKNTGQTPARNVRFEAIVDIQHVQKMAVTHPVEIRDWGSRGDIGAGQESSAYVTIFKRYASQTFKALFDGPFAIVIYGSIFYEDVFGGEQRTDFALFRNSNEDGFGFCTGGNQST